METEGYVRIFGIVRCLTVAARQVTVNTQVHFRSARVKVCVKI